MTKLNGTFFAEHEMFVPERIMIDETGFQAAFAAARNLEQALGSKLTLEGFCSELGIEERVLRRSRSRQATLPRHQVFAMAARLKCPLRNLVAVRSDATIDKYMEDTRREMSAWPVPLRQVSSWTQFVDQLTQADSVRIEWRDDVLSLVAGPIIDSFKRLLDHARKMAKENPASAAATLMDGANDLAIHGLHVLTGRFIARQPAPAGSNYETVELVRAIEVRIRRETEDLGHVVDRSHEPTFTSDQENWFTDDEEIVESWLEWEGKRRLSLWRQPEADELA